MTDDTRDVSPEPHDTSPEPHDTSPEPHHTSPEPHDTSPEPVEGRDEDASISSAQIHEESDEKAPIKGAEPEGESGRFRSDRSRGG
jgi:hypothetical protein